MAATDPYALAAADPVAAALARLRASPLLLTEFGDATHFSGLNRAPYPHVRVSPAAGGGGGLLWRLQDDLLIEVYGHPDGSPGSAALRRLLVLTLGVLAQMPDVEVPDTDTVISDVRRTSALQSGEDPATGQPRWFATAALTYHPGPAAA